MRNFWYRGDLMTSKLPSPIPPNVYSWTSHDRPARKKTKHSSPTSSRQAANDRVYSWFPLLRCILRPRLLGPAHSWPECAKTDHVDQQHFVHFLRQADSSF